MALTEPARSFRRWAYVAGAALCLGSSAAGATDWDLSVDTRLVASDGQTSFLDGGLGALRYGADRSGVQLGRARFAVAQSIGSILDLQLDASYWGEHDKNPIDLTEAFFELRPYPHAGFRARVKAGAFYAPISLENTASGWESPYTLSSSAIDSWIAEELRTIGVETRIDWLGSQLGHDLDVGLVGAAFGWNEPAGTELASHGFAIDDQQTTLFGRVDRPGPLLGEGLDEFHEFDGRVGSYFGLEAQYLDRLTVQALHYDNHANPRAEDEALDEYSWATRFDSAGARARFEGSWTVIFQWLDGKTGVTPEQEELEWDFRARFLLVSKRFGKHTLSARYDLFSVEAEPTMPIGNQNGHAATVAYRYEPNQHWRFTLEGVRVRSAESNRALLLGETPFATESVLQLSIRYAIGSR
jgi:hypothetical protein